MEGGEGVVIPNEGARGEAHARKEAGRGRGGRTRDGSTRSGGTRGGGTRGGGTRHAIRARTHARTLVVATMYSEPFLMYR